MANTNEIMTEAALLEKAQVLVERFVGRLKPTLKTALETNGPAVAIAVCADQAPTIAAELSVESGWEIKRVSLKPRNPSANPDTWQRAQLEHFDREALSNKTVSLTARDWQPGVFRYIQAQRVEPLCLTCHGDVIDVAIIDKLQEFYPTDKALGYQVGQVRGAITLDFRW